MDKQLYLVLTKDYFEIESYITDEEGVRRVIMAHHMDDESPQGLEVHEIRRTMCLEDYPGTGSPEDREALGKMAVASFNAFVNSDSTSAVRLSIGTPAYNHKTARGTNYDN